MTFTVTFSSKAQEQIEAFERSGNQALEVENLDV